MLNSRAGGNTPGQCVYLLKVWPLDHRRRQIPSSGPTGGKPPSAVFRDGVKLPAVCDLPVAVFVKLRGCGGKCRCDESGVAKTNQSGRSGSSVAEFEFASLPSD